ncbi:hypothetical protein Q3G72_031206 [Acer saccharum]|nr:hypothetical protein Q3G72_031206 [Acer saccharum]
MQARKMLFAAISSICALSSKKISIYNEEMIVARCFIGFIIFSRKSLGNTFKATLDGRIQAIQEESQQFPNPNEVVPPESNEQQRLLRISLRICGTVVESLPMARCAPKCEKTVQALLCRNLNVKSATLPNATSSRRIRLQDDLVTRRADPIPRRLLSQEVQQVLVLEDFWDIMPHDTRRFHEIPHITVFVIPWPAYQVSAWFALSLPRTNDGEKPYSVTDCVESDTSLERIRPPLKALSA